MELDSFLFSDIGGRANNEDAAGQRLFPGGGLFAVADGLGGHMCGEVASETALRVLLEQTPAEENGTDWLKGRLAAADREILRLQAERNNDMKTTAVALLIRDGLAFWGHVGDSRLYYLHEGCLAAYTDDHSVAYKKYKAGEITRAQIPQDGDQNHLLRCLGSREEARRQPDMGKSGSLSQGDGFLLCSDGVWEYLLDEEILADHLKAATAREWGELLLLRVMDRVRPGNDNLTLITVRLP